MLALACLVLAACGGVGSGSDLYASECARCHGADRQGIAGLGPDLTKSSFALEESDDWLAGRIRDGFRRMPAFHRTLIDEQIEVIVAFLRGETQATPPTTEAGSVSSTRPPGTTLPPATTLASDTTTVPGAPTPATTVVTTGPPDGDEILALGKRIFEEEAGGVGCASCHGFDARGTSDGPNILGVSKSAISGALGGGVVDMERIKLTPEELEAVYRYVRYLTENA